MKTLKWDVVVVRVVYSPKDNVWKREKLLSCKQKNEGGTEDGQCWKAGA